MNPSEGIEARADRLGRPLCDPEDEALAAEFLGPDAPQVTTAPPPARPRFHFVPIGEFLSAITATSGRMERKAGLR